VRAFPGPGGRFLLEFPTEPSDDQREPHEARKGRAIAAEVSSV
jgi:hypothetical protein